MKIVFAIVVSLLAVFALPTFAEEAKTDKPITITTNAFLDQGAIPVLYTCDGKDISPEITWADLPAKTQSLALILSDPAAPKGVFYHWVAYNIPSTITTLAQGAERLPTNSLIGKNSYDKQRYNGPCPPKGTAHTYIFTLYALDTKLPLPAGADATTVVGAMQKHIIGKAELTGVYSRWFN